MDPLKFTQEIMGCMPFDSSGVTVGEIALELFGEFPSPVEIKSVGDRVGILKTAGLIQRVGPRKCWFTKNESESYYCPRSSRFAVMELCGIVT